MLSERGVRKAMAMVGADGSCERDLRLVSRVSQTRGGIAEGMIREFKLGGDERKEET